MEDIENIAYCPHCGNEAPQTLIHVQDYDCDGYSMSDGSKDAIPARTYVAVCRTCRQVLVYDAFGDTGDVVRFAHTDLVYPKGDSLHASVPHAIRDIYAEAARVKSHAPNAFAVLVRRGLEAVCADRGIKTNNLQRALSDLSGKGEIPPMLAEVTDVLRTLGNAGAHWSGYSVHPLQVHAIDEFFRTIIEYIYIAPAKLAKFREELQKYEDLGRRQRDAKKASDATL